MKLEMGESLFFSWLRHVKSCQIVQLNWKPSTGIWKRYTERENAMEALMIETAQLFQDKYKANLFGNNSFEQLIRQAEVDVLGLCLESIDSCQHTRSSVYAIDVAFHENGLNYGGVEKTAARVIKKFVRAAICIHLFLGHNSGEIIFASPKVQKTFLAPLLLYIADCQALLNKYELSFKLRFLVNDEFKITVLDPMIQTIPTISDTSELFVRSIQMYNLFQHSTSLHNRSAEPSFSSISINYDPVSVPVSAAVIGLTEMKIGVLVKTKLRELLGRNAVSLDEIEKMQTSNYSRQIFGIQYPLLQPVEPVKKRPPRYWSEPVTTHERDYYICSEWYETPTNNDRPLFMAWLNKYL